MKFLLLHWLFACGPKTDLQNLTALEGYDLERATLKEEDQFPRFLVPSELPHLKDIKLLPEEKLLVLKPDDDWIVLLVRQMAYHHVAQGEWNGKPYLVVF